MAHEFKNVLMGISTFTEVVRRRTAGEVQVQNVQLHGRHPIHVTFEHIERNEVAADVDE